MNHKDTAMLELSEKQLHYLLVMMEFEELRLKPENVHLWPNHWDRTGAFLAWGEYAGPLRDTLERGFKAAQTRKKLHERLEGDRRGA